MLFTYQAAIVSLLGVALAADKCYYPDGNLATDYKYVPCVGTEYSSCCVVNEGDLCLTNGLCWYPKDGGYPFRGACTDKTWNSPSCGEYCKSVNSIKWTRLQSCGGDSWCCTTDSINSCCDDTPSVFSFANETIPLPYPADSQWAIKPASETASSTTGTSSPTASPATSASSTPAPSNGSSNTVPIIAGVVAGVVVLLLSAAAIFFMLRRHKKQRGQPAVGAAMPLVDNVDSSKSELPGQSSYHDYPMKPYGNASGVPVSPYSPPPPAYYQNGPPPPQGVSELPGGSQQQPGRPQLYEMGN